jgi:hypothetical protein
MLPAAPTSPLQRLIEDRLAQIILESEQWAVEARGRAVRECVECLNQAVRRMRQAADSTELASILVEAAAGFGAGAMLLVIDGACFKLEAARGIADAAAEVLRAGVPLETAPALRDAIHSRDRVIAAATPGEISQPMATALAHSAEDRVTIFPVAVRGAVPALLYAWGGFDGSALELLAQVAASAWSELARAAPPAPDGSKLVTIDPAAVTPEPGWESLPRDQQRLHLEAQRFARVRASEIRLHHGAAVQAGRARRDLYLRLKQPVDTAREAFRQKFFEPCPSMVDYLHLELVRLLANDDAELLGQEYPGPLV